MGLLSKVLGKVAAAAAGLVLVAACGGSQTGGETAANVPGVTNDAITFGMATPLSGASSSLGTDGQKGAEVFIKWVNDKGGTAGRKWNLVSQDDQFNPEKAVTAVRYLIDQQKVFALWGDVGSPVTAAMPVFAQTKTPMLFPYALAHQLTNPVQPYIFSIVPPANVQDQVYSDYIAANLPPGNHVFGFLGLNSPDGQDAIAGFKAGKAGPMFKEVQFFEAGTTTWQPQLIALKSAGVTDIATHASDTWTAKILSEAQALGMHVTVWASTGAVSPNIFKLAGNTLTEGLHAVSINASPTDTAVPGVKEMLDAFAKYAPGYQPGTFALHSWVTGLIIKAALEKAGRNLTRETLIKSLESLKNLTTGDIIGPVTITKSNHLAASKLKIVLAKSGQWTAQTGWI